MPAAKGVSKKHLDACVRKITGVKSKYGACSAALKKAAKKRARY